MEYQEGTISRCKFCGRSIEYTRRFEESGEWYDDSETWTEGHIPSTETDTVNWILEAYE